MASEHNSYDHNESAGGKMNNNVIDVQSSAETLSSYPSISQYEQEIEALKLKLSRLEEDTAEKMKIYNEERSNLESNIVRLRAQVERGETTRQNLEYELTLARKATNQVKRIAVEKEAETTNNVALLKEQLSESKVRLSAVEQELANTKNVRKNETEEWKRILQTKDEELNKMGAKLEASQKQSQKLNQILQEQQNSLVEMQEKCSSLEAQRQSQNNTLRHQAKDLEFSVEKEERLKKELEQAGEKLKTLDEHVEAERASHLETKFNSEIVQLRVRELETDLESKTSSLNEALTTIETLTEQNGEFEEQLKSEQENKGEVSAKLKQLQERYTQEQKRMEEDQQEKQEIIQELSQQLEVHQQNFDILKRELNQAKKHQNEFDNNYNDCLAGLQTLVNTFSGSKSPKLRSGRKKESPHSPGSSALLNELRQTLLDYQTSRTNAVNEAKQLKIMVENLTRENDGYQHLMWSRDQAVEDVKKAASQVKQELCETRQQLSNKQKDCSKLEVEVQDLRKDCEDEGRKCAKYSRELIQLKNQHASEDQTRLSFLHTVYQCLIAGQMYKSPPPGSSYEEFSWEDMMRLLSDQIGNHVSEMNRAKEKVAHMEEALSKKEDHIKQAQDEHEATIRKLSETLKERENAWKTQSKEVEEHYGKLITDLHHRVQKTQEVADESWQSVQQLNTIREELEVQNKTLKNSRKKYIKEKTSLLASCALLAGTLWPLCAQIEILKSQKRCLSDLNLRLNKLHEHTVFLCETLDSELSGNSNTAQGTHALLKFRVGVVAVLALHRFVNFALRRKTGMTVAGGPVDGLETSLLVQCGESKRHAVEFRGVGAHACVFVEPLSVISPAWFTNEQLLSHVVNSMNDLCEKLSRRDDRESSNSWSPESCVSVARIAKHCYQKLLGNLRDVFHDDCSDVVIQSRLQTSPRSNLSLVLGNGLRRCMRKTGESWKRRHDDPEELVRTLQNFILALTQRLHKVEVERRDLKMRMNDMETENEDLRKSVEKRQIEEERAHKDMENIRQKLTSTVPRAEFEKLYLELTNALEREKRAQDILNEQSDQLKNMEQRLTSVSKNSEQTDVTLAEAVKNLSEAKMEIKRKEQNVRMATKDTQLIESEKRFLQEKLNDAETAMTGAAREKETVLLYLKSVQKGLEENKAAIKQSRQGFYDLSKFLLSDAKLGTQGLPVGATLLACQSVVNGFLEVHQQTLALVTQVEAEKQAAQLKIENLESEISSCPSHINTLKDELAAACQRQLSDDELYHYGKTRLEAPAFNSDDRTRESLFIERNDSESYSREYVPLMRYESLSPVKSPRKMKEKPSTSSAHKRESKTSDRTSRSNKPSNR